METKTHYFMALRLADEAKQSLNDQLETVKVFFPFKRWVHECDYHITLAFLGFAEQEKLHLALSLVGKAIKDVSAFPLHIHSLGAFGNRNSPRIFWAGIIHEERLNSLQSLVFHACKEAGFSLETRPFTPHITLARNWNGVNFERELLNRHNPFKSRDVSFLASEVVLYKTNIGETPKYEQITNFSLIVE